MPRALPRLDTFAVAAVEMAWRTHAAPWARTRLTVMRLVAKEELTSEQIAALTGVAHATVFRYLQKFRVGGVPELLRREHKGGKMPALSAADHGEFIEQVRRGNFPRAKDAQAWIKHRTKRTLALSSVYTLLRKARRGGPAGTLRRGASRNDRARLHN